jgi:hypothetical protein
LKPESTSDVCYLALYFNQSKTSFQAIYTAKIGSETITNTLTFFHGSSQLPLTLGLTISSVLIVIVVAVLAYLIVFYWKYQRWPAIAPFCGVETIQKTEHQHLAKIGKHFSSICSTCYCHHFFPKFLFFFVLELKPLVNKQLVQGNEELSPLTRSKFRCLVGKDDFALIVCEEYIR